MVVAGVVGGGGGAAAFVGSASGGVVGAVDGAAGGGWSMVAVAGAGELLENPAVPVMVSCGVGVDVIVLVVDVPTVPV